MIAPHDAAGEPSKSRPRKADGSPAAPGAMKAQCHGGLQVNTADDAGAANRLDGRTATLIADAPPPACEPVEADIFLARDEMRLPHRFIDAVEVVSAQGHALTEGADYALERRCDRRDPAGDRRPGRVRYRGGLQRVDLLIERGREVNSSGGRRSGAWRRCSRQRFRTVRASSIASCAGRAEWMSVPFPSLANGSAPMVRTVTKRACASIVRASRQSGRGSRGAGRFALAPMATR